MKKYSLVIGILAFLFLCCSFVMSADVMAEKTLIIVQPTDAGNIDFDQTSLVGRLSGTLVYDWQWLRFQTIESETGELYSHPSQLVPGIIQTWKTVFKDDGTIVQRLVIRAGAKHQSGNPITVHDLKYTIMRRYALGKGGLHVELGGMYGPDLDELEPTLHIIDDYTMEIEVRVAMPSFWETWAQRWYWDSKLMLENATDDDPWSLEFAAKNPAGSGPYVIERWTPGSEMVVSRFDEYWGPRPPIDKVILRVVPDSSSRVMMLKTGVADVALGLSTEELMDLKDSPGVKVVSSPDVNMLSIMMNPNIEPYTDKNLRMALTYAFPYDDIIEGVYHGNASPFYGPIPTGVEGAPDERRFNTDLEKAKEYLEKSAYGPGLKLTLSYEAGFQEHEMIGVLFQANLRQIGVDLQLQRLPAGQHSAGKYAQELPMLITEARPWITTGEYMFRLSFLEVAASNFIGYRNDLVEELTLQAIKEFDAQKRTELNARIQEAILEDAVWIYIVQPDFQIAMRDNIVGYVAQNTHFHHWWEVDKLQ